MKQKSLDLQCIINQITSSIENVTCIYIFGSALTKYFNKNSDIDLAFLTLTPVTKLKTFEVAQDLGYLLKRDIDLIDLALCAKSTLVLAMQVLTTGKIIYTSNYQQRLLFEDLVFCQYVRLQDLRENMMQNMPEKI